MNSAPRKYTGALITLASLFLLWGFITSLNDILIPHLKAAFELSYVQAMLVQFCFFGAYFVVSAPAGYLVEKLGYKRGMVIGLITAAAGCLLFYPAAGVRSYAFFLSALFVLAAGITLLQVAANPYVAILGRPETASIRLTLTQALNSLGTTIGPPIGALLILTIAVNQQPGLQAAAEAHAVQGPYLALAATLCALALIINLYPLPRIEAPRAAPARGRSPSADRSIWTHRHLALGTIAIFLYVGAEVSIGSFLVNFMGQSRIAGFAPDVAGRYVALYWGGAMVGRFVGPLVMLRVRPGHLLAFNACVAMALLAFAMFTAGPTAMYAVLAVGLFNSIMFPTIFTLAIRGLGHRTGEGSGVLCMAIVGGAIVPLLQGWLADEAGILYSFVVPLVCYLYIAYYGRMSHRVDVEPVTVTTSTSNAA